jgi:hypothetical protein
MSPPFLPVRSSTHLVGGTASKSSARENLEASDLVVLDRRRTGPASQMIRN